MKVVSLKARVLLTALFLVMLQGLFTIAGAVPAEKKILVTPFEITSEENLDFLKKGINSMLEARLTEPGRSSVVFGIDDSQAQLLGADYIVKGTILIFGAQVSTDVKLFRADTGKVELSFNEMGTKKGDVIKHVDLFAENIRVRTLGLAPVAGLAAVAPAGGYAGAPQAMPVPTRPQEIWRGPFMDKTISALAVSDIDNDGKNETLVLSGSTLEIFRRDQKGFTPVSEDKLESPGRTNYLFVDVFDLDKDGNPEILITGINKTQLRPASYIYRYEAGHLVKTAGPLEYLLRVVETADGPLLLGQKTRGSDEKKLDTMVAELRLGPGGKTLVRAEKTFPFADSVFGIAFGDFMNNGTQSTAVLGRDGIISLYSSDSNLEYKSSEEYGGSTAYIEYKGMRYTKDDGYVLERLFLQQRIFAADIDGDGKTNLITVKNVDDAMGLLTKTRMFSKSYIETLLWNELGFESQDKSQSLTGYISDFTVADMNTDGDKEIVFSVVNEGTLLKSTRSQIFSKR